jgi:hypothetical protein
MIRSMPERERRVKRVYGLTPEEYNKLLETQNGVCAICGKEETYSNQWNKRRLAVDHCHETGIIRGLLCGRCNSGLGWFDDNLEYLKKAVLHLERH